MDSLCIDRIICETRFGGAEKQRISIDVAITASLEKVAITDDIDYAIDYDVLIKRVRQFVKNNEFALLETLGHKLADELVAAFGVGKLSATLSRVTR